MRLHGFNIEARAHRIMVGIGFHWGAIEIQLLPPDQSCLLALLDNMLEEAPESIHAIADTNARQAGVIGERLAEIIAHTPAQAEPIRRHPLDEMRRRALDVEAMTRGGIIE